MPSSFAVRFVDEMFGCTTPLSAGGQRDSFNALVEETLGDDCAYDTVMNIHEKLNEWVESQKDSPEPACPDEAGGKASLRRVRRRGGKAGDF